MLINHLSLLTLALRLFFLRDLRPTREVGPVMIASRIVIITTSPYLLAISTWFGHIIIFPGRLAPRQVGRFLKDMPLSLLFLAGLAGRSRRQYLSCSYCPPPYYMYIHIYGHMRSYMGHIWIIYICIYIYIHTHI